MEIKKNVYVNCKQRVVKSVKILNRASKKKTIKLESI